ncbi:MAG: VacJ family lipoprotein [Thiotrichales bacterium]|nr:MAG: VacJ family lipoprotein [Thiotrichales bacterium]
MFDLRSFAFIGGLTVLRFFRSFVITFSVVIASGCATLDGPPNPDDPLERYNRAMFSFNETMDRAIVKPVAKAYDWIMPGFLSAAVTNFFSNLDDIVVFANSLLQLKIHQAAETSARIVWNTTIGLFGLIDVASHMELPKRNEDFGQTLAFWGVGSGPYFVLPFLGPSTVRDGLSVPVDWILFDPVFQDKELKVTLSLLVVRYTDKRAGLLKATNIIDETAPDKYAYIRDAFLQRREYLIHDGEIPDSEFSEDELFEDENLFEDDLDLEKDLKK